MRVCLPSTNYREARLTQTTVDYILFIKADVDLEVNPNEAQDTRYVSADEMRTMFKDEKLKFTPWFKLICETFLFEWWEHLNGGLEMYMNDTEIKRMC